VATAGEVARAIKDAARSGGRVPVAALSRAADSPLSAYVARKLLWDPFLDTSILINDFMSPAK
jgi:hypothetical protein